MLVLCLSALGTLTIQTVIGLDADTRVILGYADTLVCLVFLVDFLLS